MSRILSIVCHNSPYYGTKPPDRNRTTILGYNFSSPFYISPCARALYGHPNAELNLVKGAGTGGILYIVSANSFSS